MGEFRLIDQIIHFPLSDIRSSGFFSQFRTHTHTEYRIGSSLIYVRHTELAINSKRAAKVKFHDQNAKEND